jgi:hypothetical protein
VTSPIKGLQRASIFCINELSKILFDVSCCAAKYLFNANRAQWLVRQYTTACVMIVTITTGKTKQSMTNLNSSDQLARIVLGRTLSTM